MKLLDIARVYAMAASTSSLDMTDGSTLLWLTTGLNRASAGKSHRSETPAIWSPNPRANNISVPLGSREQIFISEFRPPFLNRWRP